MHNAGDLAALVAAFFFAVLVCAGVYVACRLARLISEGTRLVAGLRSRTDTVFEQVQAAVDRANQQLDATSTVTAGMDELNEGMSQLTDQVSALAGLGRAIAAGPAGRVGALVYGVRHAVSIRRDGTVRDGTVRDGTVRDGIVRDGAVRDDTVRPERAVGLDHGQQPLDHEKQPKAIGGTRRSLARSGGRR
jgi:X-X-X-Leu-X-X-Gly heptad repeat protein